MSLAGELGVPKRWAVAILVAGVGVAFRVPAWLSKVSLGYDDGVYGASTQLMASGLLPFRDFFSSQGPVFLPMLRGFDILGLGGTTAPRVAMIVAGAAIALLIYLIARRYDDELAAAGTALIVGSSGLVVLAAGRLHSDGPAIALGLAAVLIASGRARWKAVLAGALIALALATKSLHLLPTALVVFTILWLDDRWRVMRLGVASAAVTGVLVSLPFGLSEVWKQYVLFHLDKRIDIDISENVVGIHGLLWEFDLPLMVLVAAALVALVVRRGNRSNNRLLPTWLLWAWLGLGVVLLTFFQPVIGGFERFAAILIPPVALLTTRAPIHRSLILAIAALAIPYQWIALPPTEVRHPNIEQIELTSFLESIPKDSYVVTDEPGLAWFAGRLSHPDTVDSSFGRIGAGSITLESVETAAADQLTCAVVSWSGRFHLLGLEQLPAGFAVAWEDGDRYVALRRACLTG